MFAPCLRWVVAVLCLLPVLAHATPKLAVHPLNAIEASQAETSRLESVLREQLALEPVVLVSSEIVRRSVERLPSGSCASEDPASVCLRDLARASDADYAMMLTLAPHVQGPAVRGAALVVDRDGNVVRTKVPFEFARGTGPGVSRLADGEQALRALVAELSLDSLGLGSLLAPLPVSSAEPTAPGAAEPIPQVNTEREVVTGSPALRWTGYALLGVGVASGVGGMLAMKSASKESDALADRLQGGEVTPGDVEALDMRLRYQQKRRLGAGLLVGSAVSVGAGAVLTWLSFSKATDKDGAPTLSVDWVPGEAGLLVQGRASF